MCVCVCVWGGGGGVGGCSLLVLGEVASSPPLTSKLVLFQGGFMRFVFVICDIVMSALRSEFFTCKLHVVPCLVEGRGGWRITRYHLSHEP